MYLGILLNFYDEIQFLKYFKCLGMKWFEYLIENVKGKFGMGWRRVMECGIFLLSKFLFEGYIGIRWYYMQYLRI